MLNAPARVARLALCASICAAAIGCSDGSPTMPSSQTSLYDKYGGAPTIAKVVNDAVTGLLADPVVAPFFAVVGQPGHASAARLTSCLRLQFTAVFGGPATYPGRNDQGDMCEDMVTAHADLAITGPVFDRFITDLVAVLKADGVSDADIASISPTLTGLKPSIVTRQ
jgi:truncated hemoglobin YjbI